MATTSTVKQRITEEALEGRLPVLPGERIYDRYVTFLWTCTAFSAATWAYLIGSFLPYVGNTKVGVISYLCGVVFGMVPVTLASGFPSIRYGVDPIDASKASFGPVGAIVPLLGLLATLVGWTGVLVALTARGAGNIAATVENADSTPETLVVLVGFVAIVAVWLIASRGPWLFERISNYVAPGHLIVAGIMIAVLVIKFGVLDTLNANVPAKQAYTPDKYKAFLYGFEFGMANAFTWWPVMGGLTRLVKRQNHVIGPSVVGVGVLGAAFLSAIAAFAAVKAGTYDPTVWMIDLGGKFLGTALMIFILAANVATMVIMIYLAGIGIQQIRQLATVPWTVVIGALVAPSIFAALRSQWVLDHVIKWLTYNGLMFAGITGITLVDYFVLRRQQLDPKHLFVRAPGGKYYFWGGINWIAVAIVAASIWFFLYIYDPINLGTKGFFDYLGISVPTIALSGLIYYVLIRLIAVPLGKGAYEHYETEEERRRIEAQAQGAPITL